MGLHDEVRCRHRRSRRSNVTVQAVGAPRSGRWRAARPRAATAARRLRQATGTGPGPNPASCQTSTSSLGPRTVRVTLPLGTTSPTSTPLPNIHRRTPTTDSSATMVTSAFARRSFTSSTTFFQASANSSRRGADGETSPLHANHAVDPERPKSGSSVSDQVPRGPLLHGPEWMDGPHRGAAFAVGVLEVELLCVDNGGLNLVEVKRADGPPSVPPTRLIDHDCRRARLGAVLKRLGQGPDQLAQRALELPAWRRRQARPRRTGPSLRCRSALTGPYAHLRIVASPRPDRVRRTPGPPPWREPQSRAGRCALRPRAGPRPRPPSRAGAVGGGAGGTPTGRHAPFPSSQTKWPKDGHFRGASCR